MSGILEQLLAAIQANTAAIQASVGVPAAVVAPQPVVAAQPVQPVVQPQPVVAPQANVTAEQLAEYVQKHIENDAIKLAFGATMRGMGVNSFPETPAHLYGPMLAAFQADVARITGGAAAQPTPAANTSII